MLRIMRHFLLLAGLMILPYAAAAQTSLFDIRSEIVQFLLRQISTPGSFEITVGAVEANESGATLLSDLEVSDDTGVWITVKEASVEWSPQQLLTGTVQINTLRMKGVSVLRPPAEGSQAPELSQPLALSFLEWPRSALPVSVDHFELTDVILAEGLLAQRIGFDAQGALSDRGDLQSAKISLIRTDAVSGRLALEYEKNFASGDLNINLGIDEAPGGVLAAEFGLPTDSRSYVTLTGSGPPDALVARLDAGSENFLDLEGTLDASFAELLSLDADLQIRPGENISPILGQLFGEVATLRLRAREDETGIISISDGQLNSQDMVAEISGRFSRSGEGQLNFGLAGGNAFSAILPQIDFAQARLDGVLRGPFDTFAARGVLQLEEANVAGIKASQAEVNIAFDRSGLSAGRISLDGTLEDSKLGAATLGAMRFLAGADIDNQAITLDLLRADAAALSLEGTGQYALDTGMGRLETRIRAPDISDFAAAFGQTAQGRAEMDITARFSEGRIEADVIGTAQDVSAPQLDADYLVFGGAARSDPLGLTLNLNGAAERVRLGQIGADALPRVEFEALFNNLVEDIAGLRLRRGTVRAELFDIEASGIIGVPDGKSDLVYVASVKDISPVLGPYDVSLGGALRAEGRYRDSAETGTSLEGFVQLEDLSLGAQKLGTLSLDHSTEFAGNQSSGTLFLTGSGDLLDGAVVSTGYQLAGTEISIRGFDGVLLDLMLKGDLTATFDASDMPRLDGQLQLLEGDLARIGARLDPALGLRGQLEGNILFDHFETGGQTVSFDSSINALTFSGTFLERASVTGRLDDLFGERLVNLDSDITVLSLADGTTLESVLMRIRGRRSDLGIDIVSTGEISGESFTAEVAARAMEDDQNASREISVSVFDIAVGGERFRLEAPAFLEQSENGLRLRPARMQLGGKGVLSAFGTLTDEGAIGQLKLSDLDVDLLATLGVADLQDGTVDLFLNFDTRPETAAAILTGDVKNLRVLNVPENIDPMRISLNGDWDGETAQIRLRAFGPAQVPLDVSMALPIELTEASVIPALDPDAPLDARINWRGELGEVFSVLPTQDQVLSGRTVVDLFVEGSLNQPRLGGTIDLRNGRYEHFNNGVILRDVEITSQIADSSNLILSLRATDGAQGVVRSDITFSSDRGLVGITGTLSARRAVLVRRDDITAWLSADLALSGALGAVLVTGQVDVERVEARLINANAPQIPTLGEIRIVGQPVVISDVREASPIALDVDIEAPRAFFVRGRGLDSEWKMSINMKGTTRTPEVSGMIEAVRGTFTLIGKQFDIENGEIRFTGTAPPNPTIDVLMVREERGLTGFIELGGSFRDPVLILRSDPALPEEQVLPQLLFGRSQQSLSTGQTLALASGLTTLLSDQLGPLDIARNALGVDVLQIDPDEDGEATVTVGQSLTDGVFLSAEQRLSGEEQSTLRLEVDLVDNVVLDGALSDTGSNSVGITFTRDF